MPFDMTWSLLWYFAFLSTYYFLVLNFFPIILHVLCTIKNVIHANAKYTKYAKI